MGREDGLDSWGKQRRGRIGSSIEFASQTEAGPGARRPAVSAVVWTWTTPQEDGRRSGRCGECRLGQFLNGGWAQGGLGALGLPSLDAVAPSSKRGRSRVVLGSRGERGLAEGAVQNATVPVPWPYYSVQQKSDYRREGRFQSRGSIAATRVESV